MFSLVLQMLGSLFLSVYTLTAEGVFYEALRLAGPQPIQDAQAPAQPGGEPPEA